MINNDSCVQMLEGSAAAPGNGIVDAIGHGQIMNDSLEDDANGVVSDRKLMAFDKSGGNSNWNGVASNGTETSKYWTDDHGNTHRRYIPEEGDEIMQCKYDPKTKQYKLTVKRKKYKIVSLTPDQVEEID